ncbi:MAG: hypothetical protein HY804_07620 [Nitrospinae bacterium]|nr:hypothetical protein [Nitrospinota bacterium]
MNADQLLREAAVQDELGELYGFAVELRDGHAHIPEVYAALDIVVNHIHDRARIREKLYEYLHARLKFRS